MTVCYWCGAKDTLADVGKELDDGKYKMVQCSKCKNAYYVVNKEKMNKQKPMTNEEYLRSCTTEQLAEWIISLCVTYFDRTDLSIVGAVKESIKINDHYDGHIQKDLLVEWLKQPHTVKE